MRKNLTVLIMLLCGALQAQDNEPSFEPTDTFIIRNNPEEVLADLNRERAKRGMRKLEYLDKYQNSCNQWAERMARAGKLVHASNGFSGETITLAPLYLNSIIPIFMDSPPHKKVLMTRKMRGVCIGVCQSPWTKKTDKKGETTYFTPGILYTVIRVYE